jgi:hypothetical protein
MKSSLIEITAFLLFTLNCCLALDIVDTSGKSFHERRDAIVYTNKTYVELDRRVQYVGVVECPCTTGTSGTNDQPLFGYLIWNDVVSDINNSTDSSSKDVTSIILCPTNYQDALNSPSMIIQRSNVAIQCGATGEPDGCIVDGASISIGNNLTNISLHGIEFVSQRDEFLIGEGTEVLIDRCRFSDTIFPGFETLRSAVVSYGDLEVTDSYFSGNYGGAAVLVAQQKASFKNVQFRENTASNAENSASAVQVGDVVNDKIANVSIIDCCFENNIGTNIVLVHQGSLLLRNRGNAVLANSDGNTKCHGVTMHNDTNTSCNMFRYHNTTCDDAVEKRLHTDTPSATPITSMNVVNETNNETSSPIKPPRTTPTTTLTMQPTAAPKTTTSPGQPTTTTNLTATIDDDSIVPLGITSDINFGTSGSGPSQASISVWMYGNSMLIMSMPIIVYKWF